MTNPNLKNSASILLNSSNQSPFSAQVFEMTRQLPRFCMYELIERPGHVAEDFEKNVVIAEVCR